jgi:hypothetical protein
MDIDFSSRSLQRACNSEKELIRRWGKDRAVDGDYPYRIILEANAKSQPKKPDGGLDLLRVTKIRILEVVNYHGD